VRADWGTYCLRVSSPVTASQAVTEKFGAWLPAWMYRALYSLWIAAVRWHNYRADQSYVSGKLAEMMLQASFSYRLAYLYLERSQISSSVRKNVVVRCEDVCRRLSLGWQTYFTFCLNTPIFIYHRVKHSMTPLLLWSWVRRTVCGNSGLIKVMAFVYLTWWWKQDHIPKRLLSFEKRTRPLRREYNNHNNNNILLTLSVPN
jgi:hypothetical protein